MTMKSCEFGEFLMLYHDGELPPGRRAKMESHLRDCAECAAGLAEYRGLSELLVGDAPIEMPQGMLKRLHAAVRPVREYEIVRTCRWTAAVAATLLVACIGWLAQSDAYANGAVQSPAIWEVAAVTLDTELPETGSNDIFAEWMLSDLSRGGPQ
jgi:anti-sigma factor RsiW